MGVLHQKLNSIRVEGREICNPYFAPIRRLSLKDKNFTIISNNCWAGHVYRYYGLGYNTPTIGLFFFSKDYIRFVKNLKYYIENDLEIISVNQSNYYEELVQRGHLNCPIGRIDDIEIVFLHYSSNKEALEKWNRRKDRIVWNNLYYKFSEQNLCTFEDLKSFDSLPTQNKFVFVSEDYGLESQIVFKEYRGMHSVPNDTTLFRKYINLTGFLNQAPFKLHQ